MKIAGHPAQHAHTYANTREKRTKARALYTIVVQKCRGWPGRIIISYSVSISFRSLSLSISFLLVVVLVKKRHGDRSIPPPSFDMQINWVKKRNNPKMIRSPLHLTAIHRSDSRWLCWNICTPLRIGRENSFFYFLFFDLNNQLFEAKDSSISKYQ